MRMWTTSLLIVTLGAAIAAPAQARPDRGSVYDRMDDQVRIMERGIESGDLTEREVKILRREQYEIRDLAKDLRAEGDSSNKRHRILERRLDRAEDHIRAFMHNDDRRYRHDRRGPPSRQRDNDEHRYW
ncbi:hypothetical protein [Thiorhodococcus fuscus]|uniref:Uncharacterized protein n=1 Tax=Thiorhodococcus fuscus TaxID=527200 RepID=A0ABW4Y997_9GAMM